MSNQSAQRGILRFFYVGRMDVNIGLCGLLGAVLSAIFYLIFPLPFVEASYIYQLFAKRGWVPYGITFLSFWGAVVLFVKFLGMRREKQYFDSDPMARLSKPAITPQAAQQLVSELDSLPEATWATVLPNRITRMLEQFAASSDPGSMEGVWRQESEIDAAELSSSYVMVKVLVWAIPILGFIGTVIGIVQAVSGFSSFVDASVADIAEIKAGLGMVTGGLSVAFETTLLALVVSLIIMLPMSALQKAEEKLLSSFDRYCIDEVISKASVPKVETPTPESAVLSKVLEASMKNQLEVLEQWKTSFISSFQMLTDGLSSTVGKYSDAQRENSSRLGELAGSLADRFNVLKATADEMTKAVASAAASTSQAIVKTFDSSVASLAKEREEAQKPVTGLIKALEKSSRQSAAAIDGLTKGLEAKVDAFTSAVEKQQKTIELLDAANRSLELLTTTKQMINVLEALQAQLSALRPAIDKLSRPRTIRVVEEEKQS